IDLGRRIFNHNWARPESWAGRETLGTGGDGLGPLFNEVSCVACHSQGGTGGSGDNNHNVQLLNVDLRSSPIISIRAQALDEAQTIHPGLSRSSSSVVLHNFGFGPQDDEYEYQQFRSNLLNRVEAMPARSVSTTAPRFSFELSQRSTPALWGLGLIESIRIDEGHKLRRELVRLQGLSQRGVSGRTPRTPTGEQGWYGWRGHVEDLKGFVVSACAVELGLEVPQRFQPDNPLYPNPKRTRPLDLDLTSPQVTALTAFIAQLPRPERIIPSDPYNRQAAEYGELVFHGIGCSECHVKTLGSVVDIYSDLLLHDMGPRISDQSPANPDSTPPPSRTVSVRQGGSGYGGGGLMTVTVPGRKPVPTNVDQEWRTPPLWGSADSAPYLHDGRAETFHDAIELHEGEASASAEEYRRLSDEQRSSLLSFLDTLRAPVTNNVE
ncbi:MAG: hypothetical protein KDA52_13495, partial [Planctomycetaceae bacterium]|nr:hypothetical protein [Planctomycetaceae bacterium]